VSEAKPAVAAWLERLQVVLPGFRLEHLERPQRWGREVRSVLRGWAEESLHFFTVMVLGYDLLGDKGSFHWEMCRWLEGAKRPQLLLCYRGAYKTTVGTIAYPLWRAAKDPERYSHMEMVSDAQLGRAIMDNLRSRVDRHGERLLALFPEMEPANKGRRQMWRADVASLAVRKGDGPTWEVRTMGQGRAGRHTTTVGMDDIVNEANYGSEVVQEQLKQQLDFLWPTLSGEVVIAKGTLYAPYDFWHHMVKTLWPRDLDVWLQPVKGRAWLNARGDVEWEDGPFAHPSEWDEERLAAEERRIHDPVVFYSQYYLDPRRGGLGEIARDWIKHVGAEELGDVTYYVAADPASGEGTSRPAIVVVAIDAQDRVYVVEATDAARTEADFLEALFATARRYKPRVVAVEAYGQGGKSIQQQVTNRQRAENYLLPVEYVTHGHESKYEHIRRNLQPEYQWGTVYHLRELKGGALERQLLAFGPGKSSRGLDMLDALAYAVRTARRYGHMGAGDETSIRHVLPGLYSVPRAQKLASMMQSLPDSGEEAITRVGSVW